MGEANTHTEADTWIESNKHSKSLRSRGQIVEEWLMTQMRGRDRVCANENEKREARIKSAMNAGAKGIMRNTP